MPFTIMGVRVTAVGTDGNAVRCRGCGGLIEGRPFRVAVMDVVAIERAPSMAESTPVNPGPFQFHSDMACVRAWMRERGYLLCRQGTIRALMRPVAIPTDPPGLGLCDGMHRDDHAFVPA